MMVDNEREMREIRREIGHLRHDFDAWRTAELRHSGTPSQLPEGNDFIAKFRIAVSDQLHHQRELFRIERRVSALESRLTELEQRRRANAPVN